MNNIGRKNFWLVALLVAVAGLPATITQGALPGSVLGPIVAGAKKPGPAYVPDELLVKFKAGIGVQARAQSMSAMRLRASDPLNQTGLIRLKLPAGTSMAQAASVYAADPNVEYVQPNYIYRIAAAPNDPLYPHLWAFKNTGQIVTGATYMSTNGGTPGSDMNIEPAWDQVTDCKSVVVAVLDTGVNYNQEDLVGNMWNGVAAHGADFIDGDADPMDLNGHGTHVAGIIGAAGNNSVGATGVCWQASIMALRVLDAAGAGTSATVIQGINFAVANGAKVINMSVGGNGGPDPGLGAAISNAQANDVVVVVAAGNDGADNDISGNAVFPCNFINANIVCVAALDQNYALATFSNWGATSVDVGAPGTDILSTWAGTVTPAAITDNFNDGNNNLSWATAGMPAGGWAYRQATLSTEETVDVLVNPANFPNTGSTYVNDADQRVYKGFPELADTDGAVLNFFAQFAILTGDSLGVRYRVGGGDPFDSGVILDEIAGSTSRFIVGPLSYDISPCIGAACSIGFRLLTNANGTDQGVGILRFSIDTLELNTTSYRTINGTSMATPQVAGLAAMLRAYNPQYTYLDAVNAIKNGGRAVAVLAGKTTTGRAVDAMGALAYINAPTGLTANVQ